MLSRVTELDALNNVLREQLDRASSNETNAVREVHRQLDQAEGEVSRWRDRVADMEVKEESMNMRIKTQEREIVRVQELVFKKDRQVREEQMKTESIQHQIETIRSSYEGQLDEQKALQAKLKSTMTQSSLQHQQEIEKIEQEVAEKIPAMIAAAVAKAEQQWKLKFSKELSDVRRSYEANIDRLTQQHTHQQSQYAEQEALKRLQSTEERVELDKLRTSHRQLKRENQLLDDQVVQLRRELNASQTSIPVPPSSSSSTMSRQQSFYNDRSIISRQRQQPVAPLDLSRSMDMSNMGGADVYMEVSEDPLLAQTMSYIHSQLAQMKSQLSITLNTSPKSIPSIPHQLGTGTSVSQPTMIYSTSLIDDDLGYNQELHTLSSSTIIHPTITNSSHLLQPTSTASSSKSINKHSVKFSAEALFNSPEHKTRLGQSQSGLSEAIETLDDFSKSRDATNSSVDIMNGNSYNSHASMGMDGSNSSSDWLNRSQQPSIISTKSETFNSSSSGSSMNATDEFKAILDGGYYEGYWRAKYMRRSNR